jgi:hypothetical protein
MLAFMLNNKTIRSLAGGSAQGIAVRASKHSGALQKQTSTHHNVRQSVACVPPFPFGKRLNQISENRNVSRQSS